MGEHRPAGLFADGSAHPPRVAQLLVPAQLGHPARQRVQREPALSGDDAAVLDAHDHARSPLCDRHDVRGRERPDLRQALELGADARPLLAAERDCDRVRHPLGVRLEVLHRGPDRVRRDADGLGQPDLDRHDAARLAQAGRGELGGDRVDEDAGPLLEPGDERGARQHVDVPVELTGAPVRRRGSEDHVVGGVAEQRRSRAASASRNEIATTRTSASVASSNAGPGGSMGDPHAVGHERCERAPRRGRAVDDDQFVAAARRRARGPPGPWSRGARPRRRPRAAPGPARPPARGDGRSRHRPPCRGSRTPGRMRARQRGGAAPGRGSPSGPPCAASSVGCRRMCRGQGRGSTTSWRRHASRRAARRSRWARRRAARLGGTDDREEVRNDADPPALGLGRARAGAMHLGRGHLLPARAERAVVGLTVERRRSIGKVKGRAARSTATITVRPLIAS